MIVALMLPYLAKVAILIDFKINQDFIAEVLCINKEKAMTLCKGKCYLVDQLQKTEEQKEKQAPLTNKEHSEVVYCYTRTDFHFSLSTDRYVSKLHQAFLGGLYTSSFVADVFRPPQLILA